MNSKYILATKYYNERELLPRLIKNIAAQTLKPVCIVLIDDGSIDGSTNAGVRMAKEENLDVEVVSMPKKKKGSLDTLGFAWNKAQPLLRDLAGETQYMAMADVDTRFPQDYFEKAIGFMDSNPSVGVVSGQVANEKRRHFPMFTGKVVRSEIIQRIDRYWDISVDSFINIKALKMGYDIAVIDDLEVESKPSHLMTSEGSFRAGRIAYYAGINPTYAIIKGLSKLDSDYLRGYWYEYQRGVWRCKDEDIRQYYSNELNRKLRRLFDMILGFE